MDNTTQFNLHLKETDQIPMIQQQQQQHKNPAVRNFHHGEEKQGDSNNQRLVKIMNIYRECYQNTTLRSSKELFDHVFYFCCRWTMYPLPSHSPIIDTTTGNGNDDHHHHPKDQQWKTFFDKERKSPFVRELKSTCKYDAIPTTKVVIDKDIPMKPHWNEGATEISREYVDRFSFANEKYRASNRKSSYRYGTTVLTRYTSFSLFRQAVCNEGIPRYETELILDSFVSQYGGYDSSSKFDSFYFLKINEQASILSMTFNFCFNENQSTHCANTIYNDKYLVLRGKHDQSIRFDRIEEENDEPNDCSFLMVDKALWLCVHGSWLMHMDSGLPYYKLLVKHWFFRSYDARLDKVRKQNVLYALLNWIDPSCLSWAKKCVLTTDDLMFNNYYDTLFLIVNRFKDDIGSYGGLEDHIRKSFLNATNSSISSLVKSVKDMITINKEHVLNLSVAKKILGLFDSGTLLEEDHPIACSVLEEMVKRRKYVSHVQGVNGNEFVRVTTQNKFINYNFVNEFGFSKQRFFDSEEYEIIKKEENLNDGIDSNVKNEGGDVENDYYTSFSSTTDHDDDDDDDDVSEYIDSKEDDKRNLNEGFKRSVKNVMKSAHRQHHYHRASSTSTIDTTEEESDYEIEDNHCDKRNRLRANRGTSRRISTINKKIAILSLYFLCASQKMPNNLAKELFLGISTITTKASRDSYKTSAILIPKPRKNQLFKSSINVIPLDPILNTRKNRGNGLVYEPDTFDISPMCHHLLSKSSTKKKRSQRSCDGVKRTKEGEEFVIDDTFSSERIIMNPSGVLNNFLWTDPHLRNMNTSVDNESGGNDDFLFVPDGFEDIVVTTDIFLCLCECISYHYNDRNLNDETKKMTITNMKYIDASFSQDENTINLNDEFRSSIKVVEPQKTSKYSNVSKKKTTSPSSFDIIKEEPDVKIKYERRKSQKKSKKYVSEESFVMIFRNKQKQQRRYDETSKNKANMYDTVCDTLFFELLHNKYAKRCLFNNYCSSPFALHSFPQKKVMKSKEFDQICLPIVNSHHMKTKVEEKKDILVKPAKRTYDDAFKVYSPNKQYTFHGYNQGTNSCFKTSPLQQQNKRSKLK